MREIVFDTETTGLSPVEGHRIFEIGAVELINRVPTGIIFQRFIDPECEISEESARITGVSTADVLGKPLFADIFEDWMAFMGNSPLIAHNANFDMTFLAHEMKLLGAPPPNNEVIDTLSLARKKLPGARHSLDALCKRFDIQLHAEREVHGALLDAKLLTEVYVELTGGLQGDLVLEDVGDLELVTVKKSDFSREPLVVEPSAEESKTHAEVVGNLDKNFW